MELTFTKHPILKPPTDEEIVQLGEIDPKLLADLHQAHEATIKAAKDRIAKAKQAQVEEVINID